MEISVSTIDRLMQQLDRIENFLARSHDLNTQRVFDSQDRDRKYCESSDRIQGRVLETSQSVETAAERLLQSAHKLEMELLKVDAASLKIRAIGDLTRSAEQMVDDVRTFKDTVASQLGDLAMLIATLNGKIDDEVIKNDEERQIKKKTFQRIIQYLDEVKP